MLSVWNVFHSREQRRGFETAGLPVHWIGNHYPPQKGEVTKRSFDWLSFGALMLYFFKIRQEWLLHWSMTLFDWYSGSRKLNTRLVWAYVEMNTRLIHKANKKGIPVVLDNPIAHMRDYYEILKPEYEALGLDFHDKLVLRWVKKAEDEYAHADWFNVGSNFVKESLVKRGVPAARIFVIHYGVEMKKWEIANTTRQFNRDKITFVYTASICPRKGIQYLIRAWEKANLLDAELIVCGGGALPWEKVCKNMPSNISFKGSVKHDALVEIYSKADVYVLPSLLEGFARSGLEAMAAGLPLIITKETGLTDVCNDGNEGWVVPSKDAEALAKRLIWCRNHPQEVRIAGQRAFQKTQGQDFGAYGAKCAQMAFTVLNTQTHNKI